MGILGSIMEFGPGIVAQGLEGFNTGRQRRKEEEERREKAIRERVWEQASLDVKKLQSETARQRENRLGMPEPPKPPDPTPYDVNADGIRGEFATEEEARAFRERNSVDPSQRTMTAGQAAVDQRHTAARERQSAIGNAVTWIRAMKNPGDYAGESGERPMLDRSRIIQFLRSQHGMDPGTAASVYEEALSRVGQSLEGEDADPLDEARNLVREARQRGIDDASIEEALKRDGVSDLDVARLLGGISMNAPADDDSSVSSGGTTSRSQTLRAEERKAREKIGWGGSGVA